MSGFDSEALQAETQNFYCILLYLRTSLNHLPSSPALKKPHINTLYNEPILRADGTPTLSILFSLRKMWNIILLEPEIK